jgi:hypothetical protein
VEEPESEAVPGSSAETRVYGQMPRVLPGVRARAATIRGSARSWIAYAAASVRMWTHMTHRVTSLRLRFRRLKRERRRLQFELGGAAYAGDAARTRELRERMGAVDATLAATVAEASRTRERARDYLARERLAIQRTEMHRPVE